jgi:hypothetical protein
MLCTAVLCFHSNFNTWYIMSSPSQLYGLDKGKLFSSICAVSFFNTCRSNQHFAKLEIQERLQSKYSVEREQQAREWIEKTVGESFPHEDFQESLKDGVLLCK